MTKPVTRKMAVSSVIFWTGASGDLFCPECGMIIGPEDDIQFDHRHADVFGGPHDYKNVRPIHKDCHKKKTSRDVKAHYKVKRLRGECKQKPKKVWASRKLESRPFQRREK